MKSRIRMLALVLIALLAFDLAAQAPRVSEKQDIAIFALGYYGFAIPYEALGNIDMEIQKVFVDLGRFNILGVTQRLSSGGLEEFIQTLRKAKEANFVVPEKYQFGEAILTEAEFNKLVGAFVVAAPVVSSFNSYYDQKRLEWVTDIKTNVTFIDVAAGGSVMSIAEVQTSGSDKQNQVTSITNAIEGIPMQLQYEIRKIPAFQINTRILAVSGSEIKLQLGRNMGIQKGDEYAIVVGGLIEGFRDDREAGLVLIKDVGPEVSTGRVVYGLKDATKDAQLREIPRQGVDFEPYIHVIKGEESSAFLPGVRATFSRGFYDFRPYAAVQVPPNQIMSVLTAFFIPINGIVGAEYNLMLGRLTFTPSAGLGASYVHFTEAISDTSTDTDYLSHIGAQAYARLSYLVNRDMRIFVEAGLEGWLAMDTIFDSYSGIGVGAGLSFKL